MIVIHCDFASRDFFEVALTSSTELNSKEEEDMIKNQTDVVVKIVKMKKKRKNIAKCMWKSSWKKSQILMLSIEFDAAVETRFLIDWIFDCLLTWWTCLKNDRVRCWFIWMISWIICLHFLHEIFLDNRVSNALYLASRIYWLHSYIASINWAKSSSISAATLNIDEEERFSEKI